MTSNPTTAHLSQTILNCGPSSELIRKRVQQIHQEVLEKSRSIQQPNFRSIHPRDLEFLFQAYDEHFFDGRFRQALDGSRIQFRLSKRMTSAGGQTTRFKSRSGTMSFEIAIAVGILFDGFGETDRRATVSGLECANRLEAMQRIFEHELVHLAELLCWETSDCAAARFHDIASRHFLHRAHTHNMITRRERAADAGIRIGSRVNFEFEGQRMTGTVNRITKRVTVLVEHLDGFPYSNGLRYKKFYIPIGHLDPADNSSEAR